jgi:hypothetical protein
VFLNRFGQSAKRVVAELLPVMLFGPDPAFNLEFSVRQQSLCVVKVIHFRRPVVVASLCQPVEIVINKAGLDIRRCSEQQARIRLLQKLPFGSISCKGAIQVTSRRYKARLSDEPPNIIRRQMLRQDRGHTEVLKGAGVA